MTIHFMVWHSFDSFQYVLSPPFHSPLISLCIGVPVTNHLFSACNCRHISAALVVSLSTIWASSTQSYVHLSYIHTRGGNTRVKVRYVRTCAHVYDATPVPLYIHTLHIHTHTHTYSAVGLLLSPYPPPLDGHQRRRGDAVLLLVTKTLLTSIYACTHRQREAKCVQVPVVHPAGTPCWCSGLQR